MTPRNEDFLFAQEAQRQGFVTEEQVEQGLALQQRMNDELQLDERLSVILVKRGWIAEEQARKVYARLEPEGRRNEIEGYDLVEKIGSGSMGTVYKAMHRGLGRPVAIKILRSDLAKENIHVERLKEEAKLLASLDHPHIVRALDAGESGGFPYFVMEYVEGESLKQRMARKGPLREVDALKITRALADALERARRMGVVHRDVKPGNIIISRQGQPKLMDLGLAKGPVDLGLTQHGATVGTPQFISPEQAQDPRRADTRSDIYSLGATLYAMLTGRPPFRGKTLAEVITKVLYQEPTPLRVLNREVSPEAAYLVERMMLKDPALRYRTPAEVVRDIDAILAGRSIMPPGFRGNWEAHLLRRRYQRWMRVGVAGAILLVLAAVGGFYLRERHLREERQRRGTEAVATALVQTQLEPATDGPDEIRAKRAEARGAVELWAEAEPERLDELQARIALLEAELDDYRRFQKEVEPRVRKLAAPNVGAYDTAKRELEAFEKELKRPRSAVRRQVRHRLGSVVSASARRFEELRAQREDVVATSLEEEARAWRAYAEALSGDFVVDPDVRAARVEARAVVDAVEAIESAVGELERDYAVPVIQDRLDALQFQALRRELEERRRHVRATVEQTWARPAAEGYGSVDRMRRHVEARLDALDRALEARVEASWRETQGRVRELVAKGDYEGALARLDRFREAVNQANYRTLRTRVSDARLAVEQKRASERERASEELGRVLEDVREYLRLAEPEKIRERVAAALEGTDATWPFRDDVLELEGLAVAQEALLDGALDHLERHRRIDDVRLRSGEVERRWVIDEVRRETRSVTATTSGRGKPQVRWLRDVAPDQLAAWATRSDGTLEAPLRAAALFMALEEAEPFDLRPRIAMLDELTTALEAAELGGALAPWARRELGMLQDVQRGRESGVLEQLSTARYEFGKGRYDTAYHHLRLLLKPNGEPRSTDAFEAKEPEILQLLEAVEAELANKRLSLDFPAAVISREGETTDILYDWESPLQLDIFRSGRARGCAAIEAYAGRGVVTPGGKNHRLHLLRGAEGLVRDCPLVLPSIFDPEDEIVVSMELFTGTSPFFFAVDVDGLQVAVLSADPTASPYRALWRFPPDAPTLPDEKDPPKVNWFGKGRGVAFHVGRGFGDPTDVEAWDWPSEGFARHRERWRDGKQLKGRLFAFEATRAYRVKVVRGPGRIALYVDDELVAERDEEEWKDIGHATDGETTMRAGTGAIQVWTWTPLSIDNLRLSGTVLEQYR